MELRHLRYFVAVAEERSFIGAAGRLRVAQPSLSKQIRDLESELGTALFERGPRGVRLTAAGRAFLVEARRTLDVATRAVASARGAALGRDAPLRFAHGELSAYGTDLENLLARFHDTNPGAQVEISSGHDSEIFHTLRERGVDVASIFVAEWPLPGFEGHRLIDAAVTGVLLPGSHRSPRSLPSDWPICARSPGSTHRPAVGPASCRSSRPRCESGASYRSAASSARERHPA